MHVHIEGGAFYCFTLARALGSDQPVYVLEPYNFDGLRIPPTVEAMAATYIESLRTVQPQGPYLLAAYCGGSPLAFEMAQQLRAAGQAVDLLVLIEAGVISRLTPLLERYSPTLLRVMGGGIRRLGGLLQLGPDKQLDCFLSMRHAYRCLRRARYRQGVSLVPTTETLRQDWLGIYIWVESQYRPRPYPGKMTCFWARDESRNRAMAWHKLARAAEMEDHIIPGKHTTCRTDHLHALAAQLSACLRALPQ
jgi:thioesterase domain-containing protein